MENMEMVNEAVTNDAVQDVTEAVVSNKGGLKTGLAIGGAMVAGALLWDRVIKPLGVKLMKKKVVKVKKPCNTDSDPMDVDDVQPIE